MYNNKLIYNSKIILQYQNKIVVYNELGNYLYMFFYVNSLFATIGTNIKDTDVQ